MREIAWQSVRRAIIVAPHADDETIGAFGVISRLRARGADVEVVVVTDGTASHPGSSRWPARRLARRRQQETVSAMHRAGVNRSNIRFLGLPDSRLETFSYGEIRALARRLARGIEPDLVVRPSRVDFHADHEVVAEACSAAWPRRVQQLTYLVWPAADRAAPRPRFRLPLRDLRLRKRGALLGYRTQTGLIDDDPEGFEMDRETVARFVRPQERFFLE